MIKKILQKDDPVLHKVCHPVTNFDQKLADLLDDMKETLADAHGPGPGRAPGGHPPPGCASWSTTRTRCLELVNPEIVSPGGGAGRLRGLPVPSPACAAIVKRPMKVKVRAQDRDGELV